jgi:hypothetical protein
VCKTQIYWSLKQVVTFQYRSALKVKYTMSYSKTGSHTQSHCATVATRNWAKRFPATLVSLGTLSSSALKMEADCFSEMLVSTYEFARLHSPQQQQQRHLHHRERLRLLPCAGQQDVLRNSFPLFTTVLLLIRQLCDIWLSSVTVAKNSLAEGTLFRILGRSLWDRLPKATSNVLLPKYKIWVRNSVKRSESEFKLS